MYGCLVVKVMMGGGGGVVETMAWVMAALPILRLQHDNWRIVLFCNLHLSQVTNFLLTDTVMYLGFSTTPEQIDHIIPQYWLNRVHIYRNGGGATTSMGTAKMIQPEIWWNYQHQTFCDYRSQKWLMDNVRATGKVSNYIPPYNFISPTNLSTNLILVYHLIWYIH